MVKRIVVGVIVLVVIVLAYRYYTSWKSQKAVAEGDVTGLAPDTQTASTKSLASSDTDVVNPNTADAVKAKASDPAPAAAPAPAPVAAAPAPAANTSSAPVLPASAPASDTLAPNAPNGMAFGGKGVYQWYRQGNLTWRINTQTGKSCIIYATMDEWRKDVVMKNGCGHSA